tara:strand:- start:8963 stop:10438 length:1476 start_codon:yes stop_codon:yes gene_type:complete
MNCFNNNRPKLSSSERTRNKKAQAIFKANVSDYQSRSKALRGGPCNLQKCNNFNGKVGFYRGGGLRNVRSYDKFLSLNRGSALCVDGAYKNCGPNIDNSNNSVIRRGLDSCSKRGETANKVKITTGRDSVYNRFSGVTFITEFAFRGFPTSIYWKSPYIDSSCNSTNSTPYLPLKYSDDDCTAVCNNNVIVTDPCNNLFGSNFCPTDMANLTQGPNKYLAFVAATKYVKAEGLLFDKKGKSITCEDQTVKVGDLVISGLFSATDICNTYKKPFNPLGYSFQWFTGLGIVEKICCGRGPNGEKNWWTFFIKILYGVFPPPQTLPVETLFSRAGDPSLIVNDFEFGENAAGGTLITIGGIFESGHLPPCPPPSTFPVPCHNWGKNPYGGGLGFFTQDKSDQIFKPGGIDISAMMGWSGDWSTVVPASSPLPSVISNNSFKKQPLTIMEGSGLPCKRNLMFGNNTEQNYLVSYDPANKNVRFNINPKLYTDFNL